MEDGFAYMICERPSADVSLLPLSRSFSPRGAAPSAIVASPTSTRPQTHGLVSCTFQRSMGRMRGRIPPFHYPATHSGIGISPTFNRQRSDAFHAVRGRSSVFSRQFRAADRPFFLRFVLALSGGTSFPGRRFCGHGAFRTLLERNPPKASPRPGWHLRLLGERAIPLLKQKKELYA